MAIHLYYNPRVERFYFRVNFFGFSLLIVAITVTIFCCTFWTSIQLLVNQADCGREGTSTERIAYESFGHGNVSPQIIKGRKISTQAGMCIVAKSPSCWAKYSTQCGVPETPEDAVLFVGTLKAVDGTRRIVEISRYAWGRENDNLSNPIDFIVIEPGTLLQKPVVFNGICSPLNPPKERTQPNKTFRIFSGHSDAFDSSHFSVNFQFGTYCGVLDGWLREGNIIEIQFRP